MAGGLSSPKRTEIVFVKKIEQGLNAIPVAAIKKTLLQFIVNTKAKKPLS